MPIRGLKQALCLFFLIVIVACQPEPVPTPTTVLPATATATAVPVAEPAPTPSPLPPTPSPIPPTPSPLPPTPSPTPEASPTLAPPTPTLETYRIDALTYSIRLAYYGLVDNLAIPIDKKKLAVAGLTGMVDALRLHDADRDEALNVQFTDDTYTNYTILRDRFETLVAKYGTGKLPVSIMRSTVDAMANSVGDLHTYYLNPDAANQENSSIIGQETYAGIGIVTERMDDGRAVVVDVFQDSPAEQGGIKQGDILLKVNDQDVTRKNIDYTQLIRGREGTQVTITVQRAGSPQPVVLIFTRGKVPQRVMTSKILDGNIGYIRIYEFVRPTGLRGDYPLINRVTDALKEFDKQKVKGLILDLRDNPGGDVRQMELVASLFLQTPARTRTAGYYRDRQGQQTPIPLTGQIWQNKYEIAILINNGSGSAAEILPMAMKEYKAAYLIGEKTAGAVGTTNSITLLDDSQLWYTSSIIYGPVSDTTYNQRGIEPDLEVPNPTAEDYAAGREPQLTAALKYLQGKLSAP